MCVAILLNFSIAVLHTLMNGTDQFVVNVFLLRGQLHQVSRDVGLIIPDILHIILPIIEYILILRSVGKIRKTHAENYINVQDVMISFKKDSNSSGKKMR